MYKLKDIQLLIEKAASKFVAKDEAGYFAEKQIDNFIKKFPRINGLDEAIKDLENWNIRKSHNINVVIDKNASMIIDFNTLAPSLKLKYIHDNLEKKAKKNGIAFVGIKNSGGIHSLNLWTDSLALRDLLSICFFNGGRGAVVPYGGTIGLLGTNPMSYSIPSNKKPVIADFATSEIPYFEIIEAKKENKLLKQKSAVDDNGEITRDPDKALKDNGVSNLLPLGGGIKGYLLVYLVEVLTGSLIGCPLSTEMSNDYIPEEHGGLIIAFDIESFNKIKKFKNSVSEMNDIIRKQKARKDIKKVKIPGDNSYKRAELIRKKGVIELNTDIINRLRILAK